VFAGTGSGKSATAKTQILHWKGSSVVFDPSIELGPALDGALRRQRKKVFHIGIPDPSLPIQMTGLNVLAWLDTSHPEIDAHLRSTVVRIYDEDRAATVHNEDEFFATMGRNLVTCILADLVYSDPNRVEISLATFAKGMSSPEDDMLDLIKEIYHTSRSAMARHYAGSLMGSRAKETFSSIRLTAVKGIEWLFSPIYADLVSVPTENFDPQALLLGNCTVFININLRTLESTPAIARVLIGSLLNTVFMANGYVRGWILFLIDEAFKAGADKGLETARDMGRHYKVIRCGKALYYRRPEIVAQIGNDQFAEITSSL
jgi:type IV secretion system protein VirD4